MENIEVLDFDDEVKILKKDKKNKKIKEKRKLKKSEKIFLIVNILIIFGIIGIYAYRTIHYYKLTHNVIENLTIKDKLTALTNITYQNDGLYEKDGYYYFKGSNVDNYVFYSGRLFRIISVNNGIKMIEDSTNTNLVWDLNSEYSDSMIHSWLTNYVNTLKDYEDYLIKNKWCNESIDVENYQCKKTINDYVGLLSTEKLMFHKIKLYMLIILVILIIYLIKIIIIIVMELDQLLRLKKTLLY